ncbi:hypothetical protein CALVIDRAFT_41656 [Calocera viscosa TUFC12733]|uniref:Large ribosomal subunit protein bL32m n=1 Tax=Calocera viscosa (strain TUFC12733) TaxID=1330018 RepID=A0A167P353_CALVF|nr:hypothetical protein CALVIDRAFT_41656 [Calocera viscosa TUFC12733]
MAALVAAHFAPSASRQSLFQLLHFPTLYRRILPFTVSPPVAAALGVGLIQHLLDLFPPFLLAVPKKKVSHSRKAMRSANKGLKDKINIVNCPACGAAKLSHHLCQRCYTDLNKIWNRQSKEPEGFAP